MGIGLILSGIGQGVSNAGATYGNAMGKAAEFEWKQLEEDRSYAKKLELEEKRQEALKQRVISEIQQVNTKAGQIASDRAAAQQDVDASKIAAVTPSMDQDQVKQLMRDNPAYVEAHRKAGTIDAAPSADKRIVQAAQDKIDAALSIGAHSSVIETYQKNKESILKEIREDNRDEIANRREDRREKEFAALLPIRQQTADAATDRANRPAATKPNPADKPPTGIDLERNTKAAKEALAMELGVPVKDVQERVAQLKKKGTITESVQARLDSYNNALSKWQNYKTNQPANNRSSDNASSRPSLSSFYNN